MFIKNQTMMRAHSNYDSLKQIELNDLMYQVDLIQCTCIMHCTVYIRLCVRYEKCIMKNVL